MAKTLAAHRSGLLAYHDVMITSGPLEGTNNKIKTMKRQAYGFRDREFFKLKILAINEAKYALDGGTRIRHAAARQGIVWSRASAPCASLEATGGADAARGGQGLGRPG